MERKKRKCKICKTSFNVKSNNHWYCDFDCAMTALKIQKDKKEQEFQEMKKRVNAPKRKTDLQKEINKLARKIDNYFGFKCIDCNSTFGKQIDGAHFHNVQGNENIRFNLHNIHAARSHCNKYSSEHKVGYREGIIKRYGEQYLEYIDIDIPKIYPYIGLNDVEVKEKLKIVRKLNRDFSTFKFDDGIKAREKLNQIIGIYE